MTSKIEQIQSQLDSLGIEPVIGLETHVTITSTDSKLFCSCKNQEGALPNTCICPICTGQMGVLPLLNKQVVKEAVKLALAIKSRGKDRNLCLAKARDKFKRNRKNPKKGSYYD